MELPMILVNFKCYEESTGKNAIRLAKDCSSVSRKFNLNIAVAPQYTDIQPIAKLKIPTFAQHIDPLEPGAFTGHVTSLAVKEAGALGTLISHSERKLTLEEIGKCIEITKKNGLISVVCSDTLMKSKDIAMLKPDFIAYEPPELIGSGVSVSKTKPEVVRDTVNTVKGINPDIKVLCGAGITNAEDVKKALELGTEGVLVASGVIKAQNPKKVLTEFARAIKP